MGLNILDKIKQKNYNVVLLLDEWFKENYTVVNKLTGNYFLYQS